MSNLLEKLKKSGSIKDTLLLSESKFFNIKDTIPTSIPIINIALSGSMKGGLSSGLTFIAGESKNFKSLLGLMLVKAYLKKYEDAICFEEMPLSDNSWHLSTGASLNRRDGRLWWRR